MKRTADNGYISRFLIHWTGTDGHGRVVDAKGARILSLIASTRRLLLSYNPVYKRDWSHEVHEKMVCFTDVPIRRSAAHCSRYGRFGIAFRKLPLMNVGAQPVFYVTHVWKKDLDAIFEFLQSEVRQSTIDAGLLRALLHHFYFTQHFSKGRADRSDTYYYEREWRLGAQSLPTAEELQRDNAKWRCVQEGYPSYIDRRIGIRVVEDEEEYFAFEETPVAFLVSPADWRDRIDNPHGFEVRDYESLVMQSRQED
jgi:hypothetical protein